MTAKERPGVFARVETRGILGGAPKGRAVALAAPSAVPEGTVYSVSSLADIMAFFPGEEAAVMGRLCKTALANGAKRVLAASAGGGSLPEYTAAFALLGEEEQVGAVVCAAEDADTHHALLASVQAASAAMRERIGVIACKKEAVKAAEYAAAFNSERLVLAAQRPASAAGEAQPACLLAAALAARAVSLPDGATPLNGMVLEEITGLDARLSEEEIDLLVRGGVTPFEQVGGRVEILRAVTTRTSTEGVADKTFRELNTVLAIDDVIPTVREALRLRLGGAKNNERTRGAIATQVTIELEAKKQAGVIDSYHQPRIYADPEDPSVCIVELEFTVVRGLNQIQLVAHIAVS